MRRGEYDRTIAIRRGETRDDGLSTVTGTEPANVGMSDDLYRYAKKVDVSDAEKVRAAQQRMEVTSRFRVRSDSLTRTLTSADVILDGDTAYAVTGIKEVGGRNVDVEITAVAQPYPADPAA